MIQKVKPKSLTTILQRFKISFMNYKFIPIKIRPSRFNPIFLLLLSINHSSLLGKTRDFNSTLLWISIFLSANKISYLFKGCD